MTYELIRPLLFKFDPEEAHSFMKRNAHWVFPLVSQETKCVPVNDRVLNTLVDQRMKRRFPPFIFSNPIGLAAGFDKNAEMIHHMHHLGFGYVEVGSVTASSWKGNPKPRIFRVPNAYAIVNRMGLPGLGVDEILINLEKNLPKAKIPVGVNIASTPGTEEPIGDILYTFKKIRHLPIAYVAVNISCPNTEEGVEKPIQFVKDLVYDLMVANKDYKIPILLKLSPDYTEFAQEVVLATKECWGYITGNTSAFPKISQEKGGVSGEPLRHLSFELGRAVSKVKLTDQLIISCGGITDGYDAQVHLASHADLVQLYTALIYQGPTVVTKMCPYLIERTKK